MQFQQNSEMSLRAIGEQLDKHVFPVVRNGGIVLPSEVAARSIILGKEVNHVTSRRKNRSAARSRKRTPGRERSSDGSGSTGNTASLLGTSISSRYKAEVNAIQSAYPNSKVWLQTEELWVLAESLLLPGLTPKAVIAAVIPFDSTQIARGWGFFSDPFSMRWIGPRHTNYADGSICAFEPFDRTWMIGDSVIKLLDMYTLWALRHVYLQHFGRWPGRQVVHTPFERLTEVKDDECCGCGSDQLYRECCKNKDLARDRIADAVRFYIVSQGRHPEPPKAIIRFAQSQDRPPSASDLKVSQS